MTGAHVLTSAPPVYQEYAPGSWTLRKVSPKAALRIVPEDQYLAEVDSDYNVARMLERLVPDGQRVFAFTPTARTYTRREVVVGWEAAIGNDLRDMVWTALVSDFAPTRTLKFTFPARGLRRVRLVQTASVGGQWSVSELRAFDGPSELPRGRDWKLTAQPNPWDVQLAFDNSPATRWRSWQEARPGMYVDVDFGHAETIDSVVVESSDDARATKVKLDAMTPDGKWTTLSDSPDETERKLTVDLRLAAMYELKARGFRYLLVDDTDYAAQDFRGHARRWGISEIGRWKSRRLYYIQ